VIESGRVKVSKIRRVEQIAGRERREPTAKMKDESGRMNYRPAVNSSVMRFLLSDKPLMILA